MTRLLRCSLVLLLLVFADAAQAQVKLEAKAAGKVNGKRGGASASADADAAAPADADADEAASAEPAAAPADADADSDSDSDESSDDASSESVYEPVAPEAPPGPPWREGLLSTKRGYAARPINSQQGVVRLDIGPSDFAYMDSGELNSGRGLRVAAGPGAGDAWTAGLGMSVGLHDCLEVGALILPLRMVPDPDYGDTELYVRTRFADWLSAQVAFQLPTQTDFGLGIGFPMLFPIGDMLRLDTGLEAELMFADDFRGNLDVPVALNINLGERGFAGVRTGVFLSDFSDLAVSAGAQAGVLMDDAADITLTFSWPQLVWTGAGDSINGDIINITLGVTVYIDARDEDEMEDEARAKAAAEADAKKQAAPAAADAASAEG